MTKSAYKPFLFQPPLQLLSPSATSSNYIIKVIKPLYDMWEASITWFAIYYSHYKDKLSNLIWSFVFAADNPNSLYSLSNLSIASTCATEPGLVTKKRKPPKTSIHFLSDAFQLPSLMLSSTLWKMRLTIFKYLAISKWTPMSKWQFSSNLASFLLLAD